MKFLFVSDGFPGAVGTSSGSGIGTYLAQITGSLVERGHECHLLIWTEPGAATSQTVASVHVHSVTRGYWPVIERLWPGSREAAVRLSAARRIHKQHDFDWIEIEHDEGIDIGIQRAFGPKVIVRVHTTLAQMVEHKEVTPNRRTRAYLARERRSIALARRLVVSTSGHGEELRRRFSLRARPLIIPQGFDPPAEPGPPRRPPAGGEPPTFLVVGTLDRRKGTDRLVGVLKAYLERHGPCRCVVVAPGDPAASAAFGLDEVPAGIEMVRRTGLTDVELHEEYRRSSCVLHLARYESFGFPPIEAASLAVPVVATAAGAAVDLLGGDLARFLIDGDDPGAVADALAEAARRPDVGASLRDRYRSLYTRERMTESYLAALESWTPTASRRNRLAPGASRGG